MGSTIVLAKDLALGSNWTGAQQPADAAFVGSCRKLAFIVHAKVTGTGKLRITAETAIDKAEDEFKAVTDSVNYLDFTSSSATSRMLYLECLGAYLRWRAATDAATSAVLSISLVPKEVDAV